MDHVKIRLGDLSVWWATCAAALGADEMTVDNQLGDPDRYRFARVLNRRGRLDLMAAGASPAMVVTEVLLG